MDHSLNKLDIEGQYRLLSSLTDKTSLKNFCEAFPQYQRTYYTLTDRFESIDSNWLFEDSLNYLRESVWIAHYRGTLNRWSTSTAEIKESIDQYVAFEVSGMSMDPPQWHRSDSCYDLPIENIKDKLIANHRYILKLYRHMVGYELNKRDATENDGAVRHTISASIQQPGKASKFRIWPTVDEERKFVQALYRLWVLALMSCEHKEPLDRSLWLGCVMGIWNKDFWGSMHVMSVQKIIYEAIGLAIDEVIYKDSARATSKDEIVKIDTEMLGPAFKAKIASASLLHDFPALIPNWFQAAGTAFNRQKREEHVGQIREFLKRDVCIGRDVPLANLYIFDTPSEFYTPNLAGGRYINQEIIYQRVSRRGAALEAMPHSGSILWIQIDDVNDPATSSLDLTVAIWDNWRCKTWGFKNPSFIRTNVSVAS
ncbi:hypothetical protein TWF718_001076 [Orbilia javanica]|uniref:Uncharacterized protein n=1 Tax=Orbilia javanica TaxID=47235 RepID=A0AAN8NH12_9PEZI